MIERAWWIWCLLGHDGVGMEECGLGGKDEASASSFPFPLSRTSMRHGVSASPSVLATSHIHLSIRR
jgi:hypothetical protein